MAVLICHTLMSPSAAPVTKMRSWASYASDQTAERCATIVSTAC